MTDNPGAEVAAVAAARAERIRSGMRVLAEWRNDVIAAYASRDWAVLGYATWDAYLDGEFGEHRIRLPRDQRREIVAGMAQAGMSSRAIGAAIGADQSTVVRDLGRTDANASVAEPRTVLSLDGRERPATRPAAADPLTSDEAAALTTLEHRIRVQLDDWRADTLDLIHVHRCSPAWVAGRVRAEQLAKAEGDVVIPGIDRVLFHPEFDFLAAIQAVLADREWVEDDPEMRIWLSAWAAAREPEHLAELKALQAASA